MFSVMTYAAYESVCMCTHPFVDYIIPGDRLSKTSLSNSPVLPSQCLHILLPSTGTTHSRSVDGDPGIYTALTERTLEDNNGMTDTTLVV